MIQDNRWRKRTVAGIQVESFYEGCFLTCLGRVMLWVCTFILTIGLLLMIFAAGEARAAEPSPADLWKGLIAEETNGSYELYYATAWCVRNRLERGLWHGLVALKRKDLDRFVAENVSYVKARYDKNTEGLAKEAIEAAFAGGQDPTNGATHYEDLEKYPLPGWAKGMKVTAVIEGRTFFRKDT